MVVQHNLKAMNTNRMLGLTTDMSAKSTEKLSSGYRINRAADDAAGLAISEKMRKQIRGLDRASLNAEDGISSVQTAEGALAEVHDMLQRMNELCVQAANGTNSKTDRQAIQNEIDQLVTEIDRVAETTKFNDTYLLKGDKNKETKITYITNYAVTFTKNITSNAHDISALPYKVKYKGINNIYIVSNDIFSASMDNTISANKIQKGDDITDYMTYLDVDNKADASLDISKYAAMINVELNSQVLDGYNGAVNSEITTSFTSPRYQIDLSTNGVDDTVRANRELYVYDTETSNIRRVAVGDSMAEYLNQDNTMKDRYRLVDILNASKEIVNKVAGITTVGATMQDVVRYTGETGVLYYVDPTDLSNVSEIKLEKGQDISGIYYERAGNSWAYVKSKKDSVEFFKQYIAYGYNSEPFTYISQRKDKGYFVANVPANHYNYDWIVGIDGSSMVFSTSLSTQAKQGNAFLIEPASVSKSTIPIEDTSLKVKESILGGQKFSWTDYEVEIDESLQKLYDSDGQEVSGIALNKYFDKNGKYTGGLYTTNQARAIDEVFANADSEKYKNISSISGKSAALISQYIVQSSSKVLGDYEFNLHVGADSDRSNKIGVGIMSLTAAGLGINKLHSNNIGIVDETGNNATDAIDVIAAAIQKVSTQRSTLGAVQNRLEHTIRNLDNVVENTQAAESQIRDTDMATEMVRHSNTNVLQQAGQSMLAQANQANQGVVSLLQ